MPSSFWFAEGNSSMFAPKTSLAMARYKSPMTPVVAVCMHRRVEIVLTPILAKKK